MQEMPLPRYLYKIVTLENWKASQGKDTVVLETEDDNLISFVKKEELHHMEKRYASHGSHVILKVETCKLPGTLSYKGNAMEKYYYLHDSTIPMDAVAETEIIKR